MPTRNAEQPSDFNLDAMPSAISKIQIPQWTRAMALALLASGCATLKSNNETATAETASVIEQPIHCYRELKSLHANSLPFSEAPACDHPVPDALSQTVEFTENIRAQSGKGQSSYSLNTTIKPANLATEFCKPTKIDKWITPSSNQPLIEWSNEELIGLSLDGIGGNVGTFDANTLLINREIRTLAERGSHLLKILTGYHIEKTPEGVRFKATVVDCH